MSTSAMRQRPTLSNEEQLWLMQQVKLNSMTIDEAVSWTEARENELRSMEDDVTPTTTNTNNSKEKVTSIGVKPQFRATKMLKTLLNKRSTKKAEVQVEKRLPSSSEEPMTDAISTFANDLKNKQVYNFSIYKCAKHKAPQKRILQIDFDAKQISIIHHGNIVKNSPFSSLGNVDGQEGKKLFIHFDDSQEIELNAENLADKTKLIRLLNVVSEQNEYEERGKSFDPCDKLQLSFKVIKEGYLEKKGGYSSINWHKRLVVIRAGELAYYRVDEEEQSAALNIIHLSPGSVAINPEESNYFTLATTKESYRFRLPEGSGTPLSAQEALRDEWISAIREGCSRHYQTSSSVDGNSALSVDMGDDVTKKDSYDVIYKELEKIKKEFAAAHDGGTSNGRIEAIFSFVRELQATERKRRKTVEESTTEKRRSLHDSRNSIVNIPELSNVIEDVANENSSNVSPLSPAESPATDSGGKVERIPSPHAGSDVPGNVLASPPELSRPEQENPYEVAGDVGDNTKQANGYLHNGIGSVFLKDLPPAPLISADEHSVDQNEAFPFPPPPPIYGNITEIDSPPTPNIPPPPAIVIPPPPGVPLPPPILPPSPGSLSSPPPMTPNGQNKTKQDPMRPFHWAPVPKQMLASSMWRSVANVSDQIDVEELQEMFHATNDKKLISEPHAKGNSDVQIIKKKPTESYLDQKTAQNLGIFLAGFKLRGEELIRKISIVNEDAGISTEYIIGLRKYCPEPELKTLYAKHAGREEELAKEDRFLAELCHIPRLGLRLETLSIVRELPQEIESLQPEIELALNACLELLNSKLLESLLVYVLAVTNQINSTNTKGTTKGIRLSSLLKTVTMRTNDRKLNLLQVVLKLVKKVQPNILHLQDELTSIRKTQSYSTKGLLAEIDIMRKSAFKVRKNCELLRRKKNQPTKEDLTFCSDIEAALAPLEININKMSDKCLEIKRTLGKILIKFGESPETDSQELFGWIRDFMEHFRKSLP